MYKKVLGVDVSSWVSLVNYPRNTHDSVIQTEKLGSVVGAKKVLYIKHGRRPTHRLHCWTHLIKPGSFPWYPPHSYMPIDMDSQREMMSQSLFSYDLIGFETNQKKASRIKYIQSLMIHAMTLTAIDLDRNGTFVKWREENSWGKDSGQNGYYAMDQQYLKDYVYQIVVNDAQLLQRHQDVKKNWRQLFCLLGIPWPLWLLSWMK